MATTRITKRFRPATVGTEDNWTLKKGSSKPAAVDPLEPLNHDDYGTYIEHATLSTQKQSFKIDRDFPEKMGTIYELRVHCRADPHFNNADIKLSVALTAGPTWVTSAGIDLGTGDWIDRSAILTRPGGGSWTETDLHDTTFQFAVENASAAVPDHSGVTSLWVEVDYLPTDESGGAIPPEFPSRKLRRSRLPVPVMSAVLRGDALDIDIGTDFEVVHSQGPAPGGAGWGEKSWQRRRFRCIGSELDLNTMKVRMRAIDLRDYACMFWHTGISPYTYESDEQYPDGPAVLTRGVTETYERWTKTWVLNASNQIVELPDNAKRFGADGLVIEGYGINRILNSGFFNGWTGWTQINPTRMSLDTATLLYRDVPAGFSGGTNQTAKLNYIDGAGGCSIWQNTALSFGANDKIAVSVWHKDSNATYPPRLEIYNNTTAKYYNAGTGLWQAGVIQNYLTGRTTWGRSVMVFPQDSTAGTLRILIGSPNIPGVGNQYSHIGQVQLEWNSGGLEAATMPIPTFTLPDNSRDADIITFSNNVGRRLLSPEAGTLIARCKFLYSSPLTAISSPATAEQAIPIILVYHNASNWAYLAYQQDTDQLQFTIKAGGTKKTAYTNFTPTEGQTYVFAARWTSTEEELDLPARTISVFLDGIKGTDIEHTAYMTEVDTSYLRIGNPGASGFGWNSRIREPGIIISHIEILPFPLSDTEIKARP